MNRRIVLIVVAIALAVAGTVAVYSYAHSADQRAAADGRAVQVLVATKRVEAGTTWAQAVKGGELSTQTMPAGSTPSSALHDVTDAGVAQTSVAQSDIAPGQIVLREAFGAATAQTGVLAVPKGMVAITVSLGSDADVAGYVGPRSQVAIFLTAPLSLAKGKQSDQSTTGSALTMTKTLLPRALVIATSAAAPTNLVGQGSGTATGSGGSVLVTLAVRQADAERIILGQHVGELYLGLLTDSSRTSADTGVVNAGTVKPAQIFVK